MLHLVCFISLIEKYYVIVMVNRKMGKLRPQAEQTEPVDLLLVPGPSAARIEYYVYV